MFDPDKTQALTRIFRAGVAAADPAKVISGALPRRPVGRTVVIGAGKASAAMARAFERAWDGPLEGLVVTRYGHAVPCERIEIVEAAHPTPDAAGLAAAQRIMEIARGLGPDDLMVALISGGGSALLTLPAPGVSLPDKRAVNAALLKSGATIGEMNTVRRALSAIKGGRLAAAAAPARVVTLAISDVPGDDPATIASGPTAPNPTTLAEAREIVRRYALSLPASVTAALARPEDAPAELSNADYRLVAAPMMSLRAAAEQARALGFAPLILGDAIEGEAREVGIVHAGIALSARDHGAPVAPPACILSGGETTVTVRAKGRGGRNTEFLLGLGLALDGAASVWALAGDTDGVDGTEDNAGALLSPDSLARMRAAGADPHALLEGNDAYGAFLAADDLLVTGPTLTNVNDLRVMLIERS